MNQKYVTFIWQGRCANQIYQLLQAYAYALKHKQPLYVPQTAQSCDNTIYLKDLPFGKFPIELTPEMNYFIYDEPLNNEQLPYFHEVPQFNTVCFRGYWQSFKYFDEYRRQILFLMEDYIPYDGDKFKEYVSIHVRRGDYLQLSEKLNLMSLEYYQNCVAHMMSLGFKKFLVFSDDIPFCKSDIFTKSDALAKRNFPEGIEFTFAEGNNELTDLSLMSSCHSNIVANSSFSYMGAWLNQNPNKIVITPDIDNLFKGHNADMIPVEWKQYPNF